MGVGAALGILLFFLWHIVHVLGRRASSQACSGKGTTLPGWFNKGNSLNQAPEGLLPLSAHLTVHSAGTQSPGCSCCSLMPVSTS